jgi:hypothetical protein
MCYLKYEYYKNRTYNLLLLIAELRFSTPSLNIFFDIIKFKETQESLASILASTEP